MRTLREAAGDDIEIMVDFHGKPGSVSLAVQCIEVLAPYRPMFAEEPVQPGDADAMRMVSDRTRVPIATGERLIDRRDFEDLCTRRAVAIVQPDLCHCGGIWEGRKIAAMAETAMMGVAPHNPLGPIAGVSALHFDVATPNFVIQEEMVGAVPWYGDIVQGPIRMVDGCWQLPQAPGLGIEVDERVAAKHPFKQEPFTSRDAVLPDGTVVDW
jgi:galactonate dehydratase